MPTCPFPPSHRMVLDPVGTCQRCGNVLSLVAELQALPVRYFNRARRLWETPDWSLGTAWLTAAVHLRHDFAEAYWLLAAIAARQGQAEMAAHHLNVARKLRAPVDPAWLETTPEPTATAAGETPSIAPTKAVSAPPDFAGSEASVSMPPSEKESAP